MSGPDTKRTKDLFLRARELSAAERAALLDRECHDGELRREVESLLRHHDLDQNLTLVGPWQKRGAVAGETVTHYTLVRRLGSGGMGEVFEAEDLRLGRKVALKFLHPWVAGDETLRARFEREARAASALDHVNICTIYEIDETGDGRLFIAMSFYQGETLKERIARGPLEIASALDTALQVAKGLERAHEQGIVHRDVKPGNLFCTRDETVKILDFGLAKLAGGADLSATGAAMGTAAYMSPEQARGEPVDRRSDIWSLGVVLYEMITGELPFGGEHPQAILHSILNDEPEPAQLLRPGLDESLATILRVALAKSPEERYPGISEMRRALLSAAAEEPTDVTARPPPPAAEQRGSPRRDSSAFVARESELETLAGYLRAAAGGGGTLAFITGEAGTGKTALMNEFAERAQRESSDLLVVGGNCNAHTGVGDPYLPFREVLSLLTGDVGAGWAAKAVSPERRRRLRRAVAPATKTLVESGQGLIDTFVAGAALAARAALSTAGRPGWLSRLSSLVEARSGGPESPPPTQSDLFEQYAKVILAVARNHPLLVLLDDLQWADAGSIGLLFHLGRRIRHSRILILGAYRGSEVALGRDGARHPLEPVVSELKREVGTLTIELDRARGQEFVEGILDSRPNRLDRGFRDTFYAQTRGHALHAVELVRQMEETRALVQDPEGRWVEGPALDWSAVPARIEAVVAERIDRVPAGLRELLVLASIEGETFTAEAVATAAGLSDLETVRRLSGELDARHRLVRPEGVRQLTGRRLSIFRFRHNLFQKYLYGGLAEAERAYLHERVGRVLEELYGEQANEISGALARHFEQAGITLEAVGYLQEAGESAARRSANLEAITHLTRGLNLLEKLPEEDQQAREAELRLLIVLGPVQMGVEGWAAPETVKTYARARELGERVGQTDQLFTSLWGLWQVTTVGAQVRTAREMTDQLLELARKLEDPTRLAAAWEARAQASFWLGEFEAGRDAAERGLQLFERHAGGDSDFAFFGADTGVYCLTFGGWSLLALGYHDQALVKMRRALELARQTGHRFSEGMALDFLAVCHQARGEAAETLEHAAAAKAMAEEEGFAPLTVLASMQHGWALSQLGRPEEGAEEIRRTLVGIQPLGQQWWRCMLAECLVLAGDEEGALEAVAGARAMRERADDNFWLAEIHRLEGDVKSRLGLPAREAEAALREAIDVSRSQKARWLELRSVMSWIRHLERQGRVEEARPRLAEIYGWFTEGLETADLREAKQLLDAL